MPLDKTTKPKKPYAEFPLTAHANGQWCKKIRGKVYFFGVWGDAKAAVGKYLDQRDDLQAGRTPRLSSKGKPTTADVVNLWLKRCDDQREAGELQAVTFADYFAIGTFIVAHFGRHTDPEQLRPTDFAAFRLKVAAKYSQSRISKMVVVCRMIFKWAFESEHLERMPRFGPDFSIASSKAKRVERAGRAKKLFTADDVRALLAVADPKWKALVLLGINAALGNADVARLKAENITGDWLDYSRGKTGIERKVPLWPQTATAIGEYLAERRHPKAGMESVVFHSGRGGKMLGVNEKGNRVDLIGLGFKRLAVAAGIHVPGMGFYWMRHSFATVADGTKDPVAVSAIMGHVDGSMAGAYREGIEDSRLRAVTDHVHRWLFGETVTTETTGADNAG